VKRILFQSGERSTSGLEGMHGRDAGVVKCRERLRLAFEPRHAVPVLEELLR
jgi:hypothetical protein